jgi:hypothetical protein
MKKILFIIAILPLLAIAQGIPQTFQYKDGTQLGRWLVKDIPNKIIACCGTNQGQVLIFFPPAYNQGKKCAVGIWQGGKGETTNLDVTEVYANSLPAMIQRGLTPYSILPNKDTLWHILVAIHNNLQSSYRTKLPTILNWILDSAIDKTRYDPSYTWASGLSEGATGTWAFAAVDSLMSNRIHIIVPMANGGYDAPFASIQANVKAAIQHGMVFMPYVGTQDPGYAPYTSIWDPFLKANASKQYFPRFIPNGTHSANVWDVPWKSRSFWDTLGLFVTAPAPPTNPLKGKAKLWVDSLTKHYPNTFFHFADSSTVKHNFTSWGVTVNTSDDPGQWTSGGPYSPDMFLFNLKDGLYKVQLIIGDDAGNTDTATITLKAYGPPACPVCPICPAPRNVKTLQVQLWEGIWITVPLEAAKIGYDDGTNQ